MVNLWQITYLITMVNYIPCVSHDSFRMITNTRILFNPLEKGNTLLLKHYNVISTKEAFPHNFLVVRKRSLQNYYKIWK